jgi:hypothetical protein
MKKKYLLFTFYFVCTLNSYSLSDSDIFYYREPWYIGNEIGGEVFIRITILEIENNIVTFAILEDFTPYSALRAVTTAQFYNGIYYFDFYDGWGNRVVGYFEIINNGQNMILNLESIELSFFGKNHNRLYGKTVVLEKDIGGAE